MVVGTLTLEVYLHGCSSLKSKRRIIKSVQDRVRSRYNVSIAEVDHQDLWQRTVLAFAAVGSSRKVVDSMLSKITNFVEGMGVGDLIDIQMDIF